MILEIFFIFALVGWSHAFPATNQGWPPCAYPTFTTAGVLDTRAMIYNCINNISSSQVPPSYYDIDGSGYNPVNVSVQFAVNNLIQVDDLQSSITMDFYFRCTWVDPRIYIPEMWSYINPEAHIDGLVITPFVENSNEALNLWLPDFYFLDASSQDLIVQTIKLRPNGTIYWSRHFVVTLAQQTMNFVNFPLDSQNFSIRFQSYAYDSKLLRIQMVNPAVVLLTDPQNNNMQNVAMNVLWDYDSWTAYSQNSYQPISYNPTRYFWVGYVNLKFSRASDGVIYRLGLPVTICLIVVGFAFWSTVEKRIEVTLQMLLVTAALYLVIGQIIPFVGYLTRMDIFVTTVFICLAATVGINFYSLLLEMKEDIRPMNLLYRTLLVTVLRVIWIPIALLIYMEFFQIHSAYMIAITSTVSAVMGAYAVFNAEKVAESFEYSIRNLRTKAQYIKRQEEGRLKQKGDSAFGEKFIKQLSMGKAEKFILSLCRNMYLKPGKADLNSKYVSLFSELLKEEEAAENAMNGSDPEARASASSSHPNRFSVNVAQHFSNINTNTSEASTKSRSFVLKKTGNDEVMVGNPMSDFRVSEAQVDSDDEDESHSAFQTKQSIEMSVFNQKTDV